MGELWVNVRQTSGELLCEAVMATESGEIPLRSRSKLTNCWGWHHKAQLAKCIINLRMGAQNLGAHRLRVVPAFYHRSSYRGLREEAIT